MRHFDGVRALVKGAIPNYVLLSTPLKTIPNRVVLTQETNPRDVSEPYHVSTWRLYVVKENTYTNILYLPPRSLYQILSKYGKFLTRGVTYTDTASWSRIP